MKRIGIVGAGLCGRLLATQLLREARSPVEVLLFDRRPARAMGPAYSDDAQCLLLNVPACRMGALPEDPAHFVTWARARGIPAGDWDFLPRATYREYVFELFDEALARRAPGVRLEQVQAEVTDVAPGPNGVALHFDGGAVLVDAAVLAPGNFLPADSWIRNRAALADPRYVGNPWDPELAARIDRRARVFLIGSGQTTIDVIVALASRGHEGPIVALSRRGMLPLRHGSFEPYPSFVGEIDDVRSLRRVFRAVRRHLDKAQATGLDPRTVIDSLRPHTHALWSGLPEAEKRRFMRHLFRWWEVIRSRIPAASYAVVDRLRDEGSLAIVAGRIRDLVATDAAMEVHYTPRFDPRPAIHCADVVVNTIGPELDYRRVDDTLMRNLLRRGLVRPGPAGLGLDATLDGALIGADGVASGALHTLGSTMKGLLWEVIAAPDIRVQAAELARRLLGDVPQAGRNVPHDQQSSKDAGFSSPHLAQRIGGPVTRERK